MKIMDDVENKSVHLCCCEYVDIEGGTSHILGCCCNCVELDLCFDRLLRFKRMPSRTGLRLLNTVQDRLRIPWKGGAKQISIDSFIPLLLLPTLGYVAAQGVWISVIVFSALPIFLIYIHYIYMTASSRTKFFYCWTLTSLVLIVTIFELPVVVTLDIRPEEHYSFLLLTFLVLFFGVKTRVTADLSHVKGDVRVVEGEFECAICHKSVHLRTYHCRICRTCVKKRDQHLAWLDCCIGESNHGWYMATLVAAIFQMALCSNLILTTACHPFTVFANVMLPDDCSDVYYDILYATSFVTALYSLEVCMFLIVLLLHECWLISLGMTGQEYRNLSDKGFFGINSTRPYSKGFLRNCYDFFTGSKPSSDLPV